MYKPLILAVPMAVLLSACGGTRQMGQIGRYDVQEVYQVNVLAPSVSALVAVDPETGDVVPLGAGGTAGLSGLLLDAAGVGALIYLGTGVQGVRFPDKIKITQ